MADLEVDPEMLRAHAKKLDAIVEEFDAIHDASSSIAQAEGAYGLFCKWIPPILEGRHTEQDRITGKLAVNLALVAGAIRDAADAYEESDNDTKLDFDAFDEAEGQ